MVVAIKFGHKDYTGHLYNLQLIVMPVIMIP